MAILSCLLGVLFLLIAIGGPLVDARARARVRDHEFAARVKQSKKIYSRKDFKWQS
jgi:hypothetical protein